MKARHSCFLCPVAVAFGDEARKTEKNRMKQIVVYLCVIMSVSVANAATTWYVSTLSGNDSNGGKSWAASLKTIQKAIDKASAGDMIMVTNGTYSSISVPARLEPLTIQAVGTVDKCVINGGGKRCALLGSETTTNIYLNGFTLTGGSVSGQNTNGAGAKFGTLNKCVITKNSAGSLCTAAGAYGCVLNDCTISSNTASDWAGGMEKCTANRCTIKNNSGYQGAGGAAGSILFDCNISGNVSQYGGGGANGSTLYRCILDSNVAKGDSHDNLSGCEAHNCLIKSNYAQGRRAMEGSSCYNCTIVSTKSSQSIWRGTSLYNCIVSSSGTFTIDGDNNWKVSLANCRLNNVSLGTYVTKKGCSTGDPKFVSNTDFHLQAGSPCIDNGSGTYASGNDLDLDGKPRIVNGHVDIGAYEYQPPVGSVEKVAATPRHPWNGLVDLQFTIKGDSGVKFNTSFSARDVAGGTNLTMKTLYKSNGTAANAAKEPLLPGAYNWVWNATVDLGEGVVLDRVTISVNVQ